MLIKYLLPSFLIVLPLLGQGPVRAELTETSVLTLSGTSTLHEFSCKTHSISAAIEMSPSYKEAGTTTNSHPVQSLKVTIPVHSFSCGKKDLENNMFKALKEDQFKTITYTMTDASVSSTGSAAQTFQVKSQGNLTVAGQTRPIVMNLVATRQPSGSLKITGSYSLLMTDYGVKPPVLMFGMLKTGNQITITFDLVTKATSVASLY